MLGVDTTLYRSGLQPLRQGMTFLAPSTSVVLRRPNPWESHMKVPKPGRATRTLALLGCAASGQREARLAPEEHFWENTMLWRPTR